MYSLFLSLKKKKIRGRGWNSNEPTHPLTSCNWTNTCAQHGCIYTDITTKVIVAVRWPVLNVNVMWREPLTEEWALQLTPTERSLAAAP